MIDISDLTEHLAQYAEYAFAYKDREELERVLKEYFNIDREYYSKQGLCDKCWDRLKTDKGECKLMKMMNDIERAIDGLERMKIGLFNAKIDGEPIRPHLDTAIAALEKQIPKKPVFAGGRYNCQCGWDICRDKQPYCMMCGKAIDWEVEE